jgi:hypothetical protein
MDELKCDVKDLFPNKDENDSKCIVVSKVIRALHDKGKFPPNMTQQNLREHAEDRYKFLSVQEKLSLDKVDRAAFILYRNGIPVDLIKEYMTFRLSEEDLKKWQIVIC